MAKPIRQSRVRAVSLSEIKGDLTIGSNIGSRPIRIVTAGSKRRVPASAPAGAFV
jgi:hypothetical protein